MSVMKPCLMTISILLILVHKTPGGLFRSSYDKSQEKPWNPCQLHQGACRNACRKHEIQYLTCLNDEKCCLKFFVQMASSNNMKEDYNSDSNLSVTNPSNYPQI
ncbi:beta-defensin 116 [Hippopotamus amphibius kiboko]|uniref:beta-defensin 116 n=1 Tax=Hippopotamus amphibius kiboko TaxID=575201 RepID=UPI0025946E07|nr:beta-defensin 116 [Hippopotamus amphibius kiboko]